MRRGGIVLAAVAVVLGAAGVFAGQAPARAACTVQLRVDVYGGGSSWALQGGLNAGKSATLRAIERGCAGLDHISGRWVSGGSGTIPRQGCGGKVCFLHVRSNAMSAADFQAFARTPAGGTAHSNIVRVAWAGNDLSGSYTSHFQGAIHPGCHIAVSGNNVDATNENGDTAHGTYDPAAHTITLTSGWPDITPTRPFIGRVSASGGRIRIDWPNLLNGQSGGFWTHD